MDSVVVGGGAAAAFCPSQVSISCSSHPTTRLLIWMHTGNVGSSRVIRQSVTSLMPPSFSQTALRRRIFIVPTSCTLKVDAGSFRRRPGSGHGFPEGNFRIKKSESCDAVQASDTRASLRVAAAKVYMEVTTR
jgi:hypothetical protein